MKKRLLFFLLSTTLFVLPFLADADIYKYVDQHGRVHLTDRPSHSGYKRLVKTWKGWQEARVDYRNVTRNRKKYEPSIAGAVITAESAYDPDAVSTAGAVGLMQLMPGTAQRYGVGNRRDPNANISGGTRYLRDLLDMFDNNVVLALAAYNAGENAVIKHGRRIPPYAETQTYVRRVLKYYNEYKKQM
jgi:soluble lytic murein transglycosylase-like protein